MNRSTVIAIVAGGVALAFAGRYIGRSNQDPPTKPAGSASATSSVVTPVPVPPGSGKATVVVFDDGNPVRNLVVFFSDESGSLLASSSTGKDGSASGPMPPRGMITVAKTTSPRHLYTVTGVMPGDRVVVGEEEDEGGAAHVACRTAITIPSAYPKAARHVVSVGVNDSEVGDPTSPVVVAALKRFVVDGKVRAIARALDAEGKVLAFSQTFVEGCTSTDAGAIKVKLPEWSTDLRTFSIDASGTEKGTLEAKLTLIPAGSDGFAFTTREAPIGAATKLELIAPRPLGTRGRTKLEVKYEDGPDRASLDERRENIPEQTKVTLSERLLPRVREATIDGQATPRPGVRWKSTAPLSSADAIVARLAWPESREAIWTIVAPPDSPPRLVVPALPEELASWRPGSHTIAPAVGAIETSFWNGYADVKKHGLESIEDPPKGDPIVIRTSVTGQLDF